MSPYTVHLLVFLAAAVVFIAIGFLSGRTQRTTKDYFRDHRPWKNVVSLTASNLTLGTGLVYLVSGAQQVGTLMLLTPWALFAGYVALGCLAERAAAAAEGHGKNLLDDVTRRIAAATGRPS